MSRFVYLDTETTGLDPLVHDVIEVAWAVDDGPIEVGIFPHTLDGADPKALDLNGYWDRDLDVAWQSPTLASDLLRDLRGSTVVGSNPAFDTAFLRRKLGVAVWHHRLLDVATYAAGVLGMREIPGLARVQQELFDRGHLIAAPNHTASGDVQTLRDCHRALLAELTS